MKKVIIASVSALLVAVLAAVISLELRKIDIYRYHAVAYDRAVGWLTEEYTAENMTYAASYYDEETGKFISNETGKREITRTIADEEQFKYAFKKFPQEVNFEEQMIIVYFFTDIYNGFACNLVKIRHSEKLNIFFEHEMPEPQQLAASRPTLRCLVVVMDKVDVQDVVVTCYDENNRF